MIDNSTNVSLTDALANGVGHLRAAEEISRLRRYISEHLSDAAAVLKIQYKDNTINEIRIVRAWVISEANMLYYETDNDVDGYGTKVPLETVKAWVITGPRPLPPVDNIKL